MKKIIISGMIVAVVLAVIFSPFASKRPDGLERVAEDKGFLEKGEGKEVFHSPLADYLFPGIKNEILATSLAGLVGVLITFFIVFLLARLLKKTSKKI